MSEILRYSDLVGNISQLVKQSKWQIVQNINHTITYTYWQIGKYIVEYEQKGQERADYGLGLVKKLSDDLTLTYGKGYSYRNLQLAKKLYNTFPIMQSLIAQSSDKDVFSNLEIALKNVSWTHLVRLLSIQNETERNFYLIETVENNWSVRELNRQIDAALFERLLINKNEKALKEIVSKGQKLTEPIDILKDPYVLEFLGLEETNLYSENPTIGIILCKEKNDFVVEYSLPKENTQIYPKEYLLYLPDKEELKKLLSKYL